MGTVALLVAASLSAAREPWQSSPLAAKHSAAKYKRSTHDAKPEKPSATAQMRNHSAFARTALTSAKDGEHHLILQVNNERSCGDESRPQQRNERHAILPGARRKGESRGDYVWARATHAARRHLAGEGPYRDDGAEYAGGFVQSLCNTQENMHKAENNDIPIVPQAQVVKSGVVRVMELEEQGWSYVKP